MVDSRILDKVLSIEEKNRKYLQQLVAGQEVLKKQLDAQQTQLDQITQSLSAAASDAASTSTTVVTGKGKSKEKNVFYKVSIYMPFIHDH